jgi:hypothetical protein
MLSETFFDSYTRTLVSEFQDPLWMGMGTTQDPSPKSIIEGIRKDAQGRLQLPRQHPDSDYCKKMKRMYWMSYGISGFSMGIHTGYLSYKKMKSSQEGILFEQDLLANPMAHVGFFLASAAAPFYNGRLIQDNYRFECGPPPPAPPGKTQELPHPPTKSNRVNDRTLHMTKVSETGITWEKLAWGMVAGAALVTAGFLLLSPVDGPLGEAAMATVALTAFSNTGF